MKHLLKGTSAAVVTLLALAAPASAGSILNAAGQALHNNPVYVAPGASPALTSSEAASLRQQINAGKHPMFIAVLPAAVKNEVGSPDRLIPALIDATRLSGVYAAVAGPVFRGGETSQGGVPNAAPEATQIYNNDQGKGLYPMLRDYVSQVESAPVLVGGVEKKPSRPFPWLWVILPIVLFLLLVGGLGYWLWRRRQQADVTAERDDLLSRIYSLQSQINGLSTIGDTANYNAALDLVQRAASRAESAKRDSDIAAAEGLYRQAQQSYTAAKRSTVAGTATTYDRDDFKHPETKAVHKSDLPEPTAKLSQTTNTYRSGYEGAYSQTCYPGYNYGYYPGYGYGYVGFDGNFVMGMLEGEMLASMMQPEVVVEQPVEQPAYAGDSGGGYDSGYSGPTDSGGGGGWDSGSSSSSYDSGSSSDSGGGGSSYSSGYDSGGSYDSGGGGYDGGGGGGDSGGGGSW